jgi:hypothetical protein
MSRGSFHSQFFIMVRLRIDTAQRGICVPGRK